MRVSALTLGWTKRDSRSVRVETLAGEQLWASVRVRSAERDTSAGRSGGLPAAQPQPAGENVQRSLVLLDAKGTAVSRVPIDAVRRRTRFLTLPAAGARPELQFGPVDVAVMRRLVVEATGLRPSLRPSWASARFTGSPSSRGPGSGGDPGTSPGGPRGSGAMVGKRPNTKLGGRQTARCPRRSQAIGRSARRMRNPIGRSQPLIGMSARIAADECALL